MAFIIEKTEVHLMATGKMMYPMDMEYCEGEILLFTKGIGNMAL